jgi:hypothetical protein
MRKKTKFGFLPDLAPATSRLGAATDAIAKPIILTKSRRFKNLSVTIVPFHITFCNVVFEVAGSLYYNAGLGFWQHFFAFEIGFDWVCLALFCRNPKTRFFS